MNKVKLILLCGIPGSGKTTYAKKYSQYEAIHISSDQIRKELYGDESIQGNPGEVFSLMQKRTLENLNNGVSVYYDATNVTRKDRAGIIAACPKFAYIECHIIWAPIETCIERDATRERTVGKAVIDKMLKRFQPPYYDEGINEVRIILPNDFNYEDYAKKLKEAMKIPHDNPHHTFNIYDHCFAAKEYAEKICADIDLWIAAFLHDIGKPYVKSFQDNKGNVSETAHYYSHQNLSAWMSYGFHDSVTPFIAWLIGVHMEPFFNSKYYQKLPAYLKRDVDILHECDLNAH